MTADDSTRLTETTSHAGGGTVFVAVIGLHSSGSSCIAGLLHHLGVYLGRRLGGYYGRNPAGRCGFEAKELARICERAVPFPATALAESRERIEGEMGGWLRRTVEEARALQMPAGGKYPQMCRLGFAFRNACSDGLLIVHADRPVEQSISSLIRRCPDRDAVALREHQQWLNAGKQELLALIPGDRQITLAYDDVLHNPRSQVERLVQFLPIRPVDDQIRAAVRSVDPEMRHISQA